MNALIKRLIHEATAPVANMSARAATLRNALLGQAPTLFFAMIV
jgi:hypothetical protein